MTKLATEMETAFATAYEAVRDKGASDLRAQAWEAFTQRGLPNRRVEAWHYTDLKAALAKPAPLASGDGFDREFRRTHDSVRFVILNGKFRPELSDLSGLPVGIRVQTLDEALASGRLELTPNPAAVAGVGEFESLAGAALVVAFGQARAAHPAVGRRADRLDRL